MLGAKSVTEVVSIFLRGNKAEQEGVLCHHVPLTKLYETLVPYIRGLVRGYMLELGFGEFGVWKPYKKGASHLLTVV